MGVYAIVASVSLVVALVGAPIFLSVLSSFFPQLAPSRRTSGRIIGRGAACLIAAMCLLAYFMWVTRFLPFALAIDASRRWGHIVVANTLWFGTVCCWASACLCSPSAPPRASGSEPDCDKCGSARHPRAEHCHLCGTCVEGFDHHCPFIAQCVGAHNRRSFFAFLLFGTAGTIYASALSFDAFFSCIAFPIANLTFEWGSTRPRPDQACRLVQEYALLCLPTVGMCILVTALTAWQAILRAKGESTADFVRRWRLILAPKSAAAMR
jgi:hypothetical protein